MYILLIWKGGMVKRPLTQKGFTLIELLIAMVLLLVGFLAILTVHWASARNGTFSRKMTTAAILNQQSLEQLGTLSYNDNTLLSPTNGSFVGYNESNITSGGFTRQIKIDEDTVKKVKTITVLITWQDGNTTKTRTLQMIKRPDY